MSFNLDKTMINKSELQEKDNEEFNLFTSPSIIRKIEENILSKKGVKLNLIDEVDKQDEPKFSKKSSSNISTANHNTHLNINMKDNNTNVNFVKFKLLTINNSKINMNNFIQKDKRTSHFQVINNNNCSIYNTFNIKNEIGSSSNIIETEEKEQESSEDLPASQNVGDITTDREIILKTPRKKKSKKKLYPSSLSLPLKNSSEEILKTLNNYYNSPPKKHFTTHTRVENFNLRPKLTYEDIKKQYPLTPRMLKKGNVQCMDKRPTYLKENNIDDIIKGLLLDKDPLLNKRKFPPELKFLQDIIIHETRVEDDIEVSSLYHNLKVSDFITMFFYVLVLITLVFQFEFTTNSDQEYVEKYKEGIDRLQKVCLIIAPVANLFFSKFIYNY